MRAWDIFFPAGQAKVPQFPVERVNIPRADLGIRCRIDGLQRSVVDIANARHDRWAA